MRRPWSAAAIQQVRNTSMLWGTFDSMGGGLRRSIAVLFTKASKTSCRASPFRLLALSGPGSLIDTYGGCGRVGSEKVPLSFSGPASAPIPPVSCSLRTSFSIQDLARVLEPDLCFCPTSHPLAPPGDAQPSVTPTGWHQRSDESPPRFSGILYASRPRRRCQTFMAQYRNLRPGPTRALS